MSDTRQLAQVVQRLLRSGALARARRVLERVHPADLGLMLRELRPGELGRLLTDVLPIESVGALLDDLPPEDLPRILGSLGDAYLAEVLERLDAVSGVRILEGLAEERREAALTHVRPERRAALERTLSYPLDTAGRSAVPVPVRMTPDTTAEEAITALRRMGSEDIWDLYVVAPGGQLVGIVPMRRLVVAHPGKPLSELLVEVPVTVNAHDPVEEAARVCARYDLMAVPVVGEHHNLIGIITVDDVLDIVEREATEALYGIAGLEKNLRVQSGVREHLVTRVPWVVINLITASLAATVVGSFEDAIAKAAFLAAFMPVVAGMGGNMGTQTLTLVTRGIALGEVGRGQVTGILLRQMAIGAVLGIGVGGLVALGSMAWIGDVRLAIAIVGAMVGNFLLGAVVGTMVPVLFEALDRDPAVGSGVIVTATTDVLGFLQFLLLAALLLGL